MLKTQSRFTIRFWIKASKITIQ